MLCCPKDKPEKWEPVLDLLHHIHDYPPSSHKEIHLLLFRDTGVCFSYELIHHCMPMNMAGTASLLSTVKKNSNYHMFNVYVFRKAALSVPVWPVDCTVHV